MFLFWQYWSWLENSFVRSILYFNSILFNVEFYNSYVLFSCSIYTKWKGRRNEFCMWYVFCACVVADYDGCCLFCVLFGLVCLWFWRSRSAGWGKMRECFCVRAILPICPDRDGREGVWFSILITLWWWCF